MAKKKFRGVFDSSEEWYFYLWLLELKQNGYVKEIKIQPEPYSLFNGFNVSYKEFYQKKEGFKMVEESILRPHIYTPDFHILWDERAKGIFYTPQQSQIRKKTGHSLKYLLSFKNEFHEDCSIVEVKPSFDQNNMTRLAKINQSWVFQVYGEYVNILIPVKHFAKTFTPARYFYTDSENSTRPRTIKHKPAIDLETFIAQKI